MPIETYYVLVTLAAIAPCVLIGVHIYFQHTDRSDDDKMMVGTFAVILGIVFIVSALLPDHEDMFYYSFEIEKKGLEQIRKECPNIEYSKCKEKIDNKMKNIEEAYDDYIRFMEYKFGDSLILEKIKPMLL